MLLDFEFVIGCFVDLVIDEFFFIVVWIKVFKVILSFVFWRLGKSWDIFWDVLSYFSCLVYICGISIFLGLDNLVIFGRGYMVL